MPPANHSCHSRWVVLKRRACCALLVREAAYLLPQRPPAALRRLATDLPASVLRCWRFPLGRARSPPRRRAEPSRRRRCLVRSLQAERHPSRRSLCGSVCLQGRQCTYVGRGKIYGGSDGESPARSSGWALLPGTVAPQRLLCDPAIRNVAMQRPLLRQSAASWCRQGARSAC